MAEFANSPLGQLQMSFAKGIEDMFVAIETGSKSAKEAFKDLALFMLKKMAEMAAQTNPEAAANIVEQAVTKG